MRKRRLTDEQIRDIKRRLMAGEKQSDIANDYAVAQTTISHISLNKIYKEISCEGWDPSKIIRNGQHMLEGKQFGNLLVLKENGRKWHGVLWQCKCLLCGRLIDVDEGRLMNSKKQSCGCDRDYNLLHIEGQEFGNIRVIERVGTAKDGSATWRYLCKQCGKTSIARGKDIVYGKVNSCGCILSKGEEAIVKKLVELNIDFKAQYTFADLVSNKGRVLRFDFAILNNGQLICMIEYQGSQHYREDVNMGTQQRNETDAKKRSYCHEHNIPLHEIPYNVDVDKALQTILSDYGLIACQSCAKPLNSGRCNDYPAMEYSGVKLSDWKCHVSRLRDNDIV